MCGQLGPPCRYRTFLGWICPPETQSVRELNGDAGLETIPYVAQQNFKCELKTKTFFFSIQILKICEKPNSYRSEVIFVSFKIQFSSLSKV